VLDVEGDELPSSAREVLLLDQFQPHRDHQCQEYRRAGTAVGAQPVGQSDRGGRPQRRRRRQAPNRWAFAQDRTRPEKTHAGDDLGGDPCRIGSGHLRSNEGEQCRTERDQNVGTKACGLGGELALQADHGAEDNA